MKQPFETRGNRVYSWLNGGLFPAAVLAQSIDGSFHRHLDEVVLRGIFAKGIADLKHAGDGEGVGDAT
jgi:hypothetical protein